MNVGKLDLRLEFSEILLAPDARLELAHSEELNVITQATLFAAFHAVLPKTALRFCTKAVTPSMKSDE